MNPSSKPLSILKPPPLLPGDTVGIVSISAPFPRSSNLKLDLHALSDLGFRYKLTQHLYGSPQSALRTLNDRIDDFHQMVTDPGVKAILFTGGGAHAINLVDQIDYALVRKNPKVIVGFSDNTFVLAAIQAKTGLVTFYGPTLWHCISHLTGYTRRHFVAAISDTTSPRILPAHRIRKVIRHGKGTGRLIGGNLAALECLLGTPYEPDWQETILYFEDFNTPTILFSETLNHFRLAGVFSKINGLLIGNLPGFDQSDLREHPSLRAKLSLEKIISFQTRDTKFPIMSNMDFGHELDNYLTMPNGVRAEMDTSRLSLTLQEAAVANAS